MTLAIDISWPVAIPLPFVDYSGTPKNTTIVSATENAIIIRRSRFTRSYTAISVSWVLTREQYEAFQEFFADTLGNGVSQFKLELRYPLNSALTWWAVRFEDGYESDYDDGMWRVETMLLLVNPVTF